MLSTLNSALGVTLDQESQVWLTIRRFSKAFAAFLIYYNGNYSQND
jgi:hypothetical protein